MWLFHFLSLLTSLSALYFILLFILFNSLAISHILCLCAVFSTPTISPVPPSHDFTFFCYFPSLPLLKILSLTPYFLLFPIPWWFMWVFILFFYVMQFPSFLYKSMYVYPTFQFLFFFLFFLLVVPLAYSIEKQKLQCQIKFLKPFPYTYI